MKRFTSALLLLLLFAAFSFATVKVTFRANSSTVEGFTDSTEVVTVRGGIPPLAWNAYSDTMTNVGGDYWEAVVEFSNDYIDQTIPYKYGATRYSLTGEEDWWENHSDRTFVLPAQDTVLAMDYMSADGPPYTPSDSIDVYFRVNMVANVAFNPETDILSLVGDFPAPDGNANMWSPGTYRLTRESPTSDYWSYHLKLAQPSTAYASAGTVDSVYYRFAIGTDWSTTEQIYGHGMFPDNENRGTQALHDTTLAWKYWNDVPPGTAGEDTVNVKFRADLSEAIQENGFNVGDTLLVRWGYNFTADYEVDTLTREFGEGDFYSVTVEAKNVALNADLQYQYYLLKNGIEYREIFFDFGDDFTGSQEKRKVYIPEPKPDLVTAEDVVNSLTDLHRWPRFRNVSTISQTVLVTYACDLRPPYWQVKLDGDTIRNIQGENAWILPGHEDEIFTMGLYINGPGNGTPNWQGWDQTALAPYQLFDDGTHGDMVAGDSIYSFQTYFSPDSTPPDVIGQEFKFGIGAGDNEGGNTGYGLNHIQNIDDSQENFTIHTDFGSINPGFYSRWDFNLHVVGIKDAEPATVVQTPVLNSNYPNPFNPVTTISFVLPKIMDVKLVIYDVLGRKVRTLLNGKQQLGAHTVLWNGRDDHGQAVGSGIYFYRLTTENYEKTMQMVLMK